MKQPEKLQYKIYIDSSVRGHKKAALVKVNGENEEIVSEKEGEIDIVSSIKQLLLENNLKVFDISEFAPNLGPGSFTGLKMGVTICNVLNWVLGRKKLKDLQLPQYGEKPNISKKKRIKL